VTWPGLCAGPPDGFRAGRFSSEADDAVDEPAAAAHATSPNGCAASCASGATAPAPPAAQPLYLQRWGLLRELTTLTALLDVIGRARVYKVHAAIARGMWDPT